MVARLSGAYPGDAAQLCALDHDGPFQLLVATILSAQCTDERVNMVTPAVFAAYPTPDALAAADPERLEELIRSTGFFRSKTKNLIGMAAGVSERFGGTVPGAMDDLTSLPGVGRKTANVVRSVALGLPGLPVDTHVGRLTRRLGLTEQHDPAKVEHEIDALVPEDERVNMVTPGLFAAYPIAADLASADPGRLEEVIRSTGFFRSKARSLLGMARALEERFGGKVPEEMEDLVTLPGVGRKTANVVRSVAMGLPGLPVDTHVGRLSRRLGLTTETDPVKVELELNAMIPPAERGAFSLRLILHGRRVCVARKPKCAECLLCDFCPTGKVMGVAERKQTRNNLGRARR